MKKATGGQRIGAFAIDYIVFLVITIVLNKVISLIFKFPSIPEGYFEAITSGDVVAIEDFMGSAEWTAYMNASTATQFLSVAIAVTVFILYFIVLPFKAKYTLGRYITKIKVVDANLEPASFGKVFMREFIGVYIIGFIGCVCCGATLIINLIMLLGAKKTTIHDKLADTTMVSTIYKDESEPKADESK